MEAKPSTGRWCLTHDQHQDSRHHKAQYGCKLRWSTDGEELRYNLEIIQWHLFDTFRLPQFVDWLSVGLAGGGWKRRG